MMVIKITQELPSTLQSVGTDQLKYGVKNVMY